MSNRNSVYPQHDPSITAFVICVFLLIVLFAGEPDLMDAIVAAIRRGQ